MWVMSQAVCSLGYLAQKAALAVVELPDARAANEAAGALRLKWVLRVDAVSGGVVRLADAVTASPILAALELDAFELPSAQCRSVCLRPV